LLLLSKISFGFSQKKYFDDENKEITEIEFNKTKIKQGQFKVCNDSLQKCKVVLNRSAEGTIDSELLINDLERHLQLKLDKEIPTVIIFYPGKDRCNSSGTATVESQYKAYKNREQLLDRFKMSNHLYIYKDSKNLKTIHKLNWYKDPQNIIENTFFEYRYPCNSYVIIYNNKYRSYFREFTQQQILNDQAEIIK